MNTISLWQPWASAIAVGLKSIETRSWPAPKHVTGQPLAIAAAKRDTPDQRRFWMETIRARPALFARFAAAGIYDWSDLPMGAVVATTFCTGTYSTNEDPPPGLRALLPTDQFLGDFSANRHLWFLGGIVALKTPRPVIGMQGIFNTPL